jgi:hypothetical protein
MKPELVVGKASKAFQPDMIIGGVGISSHHCRVTFNSEARVAKIFPNDEDENKFSVKVNGELLTGP